MNNNTAPIHCGKIYQMQSNKLSQIAAKINVGEKEPTNRLSAFMLGKKKANVVKNRQTIFVGTFEQAEAFLNDMLVG